MTVKQLATWLGIGPIAAAAFYLQGAATLRHGRIAGS